MISTGYICLCQFHVFLKIFLGECADMIRANETEKLQLMFKLMDRVPDEGIDPMLADLGMI